MRSPLFITFLIFLWLLAAGAQPVSAGFNADNVETYVPTSAWLVGQATLRPIQDAGFSVPCVMVNQYNNGFVVRLSGGNKQIMAMAIDFREKLFGNGEGQAIKINVPPDFSTEVPAVAHNGNTALINLRSVDGFYQALQGGKYMYLTLGDKEYNFALLGVRDGLKRVEQCYDPAGQTAPPQQTHQAEAQPKRGFAATVPPAYRQKNQVRGTANAAPSGDVMTPMPGEQEAEASALAMASEQNGEKNEAKKADPEAVVSEMQEKITALDKMIENARQKLARIEPATGNLPAPDIDIQVQSDPQIQPQTQQQSPQQAAVPSHPIGRPLANSWMAPVVRQRDGLKQRKVIPVSQTAEANGYLPHTKRWRAMHGSNLHEVLDVWAANENARLIWQADREYAIPKSVSMEGTFEQVVATLLEQYSDEYVRPVGRIYIEPETQKKVLLIETY